jgi:cytochrome c-type biogenesis protein CcmH/NrfG
LNARVAMAKIANHLRPFAIAVLTLLASTGVTLGTQAPDVHQLRDKLKRAQDAGDKPAIIELRRRIIATFPNDFATWDMLAHASRAKN